MVFWPIGVVLYILRLQFLSDSIKFGLMTHPVTHIHANNLSSKHIMSSLFISAHDVTCKMPRLYDKKDYTWLWVCSHSNKWYVDDANMSPKVSIGTLLVNDTHTALSCTCQRLICWSVYIDAILTININRDYVACQESSHLNQIFSQAL